MTTHDHWLAFEGFDYLQHVPTGLIVRRCARDNRTSLYLVNLNRTNIQNPVMLSRLLKEASQLNGVNQ